METNNYIKYLKDNPKGYWFKAKLYGWGWVPAKWQGWLIVSIWIAIVVLYLSVGQDSLLANWLVIISTIILLYISYRKGEKPHWQWGLKKEEEKNS